MMKYSVVTSVLTLSVYISALTLSRLTLARLQEPEMGRAAVNHAEQTGAIMTPCVFIISIIGLACVPEPHTLCLLIPGQSVHLRFSPYISVVTVTWPMDLSSVSTVRESRLELDHEWQTSVFGPAVLCPGHPLRPPVLPAPCLPAWSRSLPHPHRLHQDPLLPLGPQGALGSTGGPA